MGDSKRRPLAGRRSVLLGMAGLASAALTACADRGGTTQPSTSSTSPPAPMSHRTGPAVPPPSIATRSSEQAAAALAPAVPPSRYLTSNKSWRSSRGGSQGMGTACDGGREQFAVASRGVDIRRLRRARGGSGCDHALLNTLRRHKVPATLFVNSRWLHANPPSLSAELALDPLFELANHGTAHLPLSVNGRAAYGIHGTSTVAAAYDELMGNQAILQEISGKVPQFFRPGTAFYDDVAVEVTRRLGMLPVNFTVNGDGGATFSAATVAAEVGGRRPGGTSSFHTSTDRPQAQPAAMRVPCRSYWIRDHVHASGRHPLAVTLLLTLLCQCD